MIDKTLIDDIARTLRYNARRPQFSDLTVGDITADNIGLLKSALCGDENARDRLLSSVQHKKRNTGGYNPFGTV